MNQSGDNLQMVKLVTKESICVVNDREMSVVKFLGVKFMEM